MPYISCNYQGGAGARSVRPPRDRRDGKASGRPQMNYLHRGPPGPQGGRCPPGRSGAASMARCGLNCGYVYMHYGYVYMRFLYLTKLRPGSGSCHVQVHQ